MQRNWIDKCLSSLKNSTVPIEPIIIDNLSTDGTREFVPTHYHDAIWLPQDKNLGFGQANNIGMRYALEHGADYILLLNQDAFLQPKAMEDMLKVADGQNLVSPVHLNGDGSRIDTMFRESLKRADIQLFDDLLINGKANEKYEIGEVCAACWLMPIGMLKEIGGFNPLFFQYGEDNNYYTRLIYHGRRVVLAAKAYVWHDRKVHGNETLFNKKYIHLRTMIVACDPGLTFTGRLKKWIGVGINAPLRFILEWIKILSIYATIIKSRRIERKKQPCWL